MAGNSIKIIILTLVIALLLSLSYLVVDKILFKEKIENNLQALPKVQLVTLDSLPYTFPTSANVILVYFNSECDHCEAELKQIKENLSAFNHSSLVFLSSESIAVIKKAVKNFGFENIPSASFVKIDPANVYPTFGSIAAPHLFIYNNEQKLVKEFKGRTKVETLLKYIP